MTYEEITPNRMKAAMTMTDTKNFEKYRPVTNQMSELDKDHMEELLMRREHRPGLEEYYSAHTDYMDPEARVVFIGICPGFEQMKLSFDLVKDMKDERDELKVLREAKVNARFGRSMRRNLIALADETVLPDLLGVKSTAELFEPDCHLMDNTSLLPYPVFKNGKNYTGHAPKIKNSLMLSEICSGQLQKILKAYPEAVFIPLGKSVDEQVSETEIIPNERIIHGFPHPSGANGHRFRQMEQNLDLINSQLEKSLKK